MKNKKLIIICLLAISILALTSCSSGSSDTSSTGDSSYQDSGFVMGTAVQQTIYSDNKDIASDILNLLTETEEKYISRLADTSDIAGINLSSKNGKAAEVSDETVSYLKDAVSLAKETNGAFDPAVGNLSILWDFENNPTEPPAENKIKEAAKIADFNNISISGNTVMLKNGSVIDLGAMGKGIGCDNVEAFLETRDDVNGALINIGGSSILTYGAKPDDSSWKVAIRDPRDEQGYLGAISLTGTNQMSTSGDYEKYFEYDGKRYHHIIDPSTGYPADSGLMSVTVVGDNGAECDAISTACFVLGMDKSREILKKYDLEAIFVDTDKKIYATDGIKDKFELMADDYEYIETK